MEEKGNFFRGNKMSFSQDKKIINNSRQKYIFNQFKITNRKDKTPNSNSNFNQTNYNSIQNININISNNIINKSNRMNLKDPITNKFVLKSQQKDKPVIIYKEQNNNNKILPLLDKREYLIPSKKKSKNNFNNKSFFSVDKLKLKKKNNFKRNIKKNFGINKNDEHKYIITSNINLKVNNGGNGGGTSNILDKITPIFSTNNIPKKRGFSAHSVRGFKKKKIKIKNKGKIFTNKSSTDMVKSISELKNDLFVKDNINTINFNEIVQQNNNINNHNSFNNYSNNNYLNRNKVCDYTITIFNRFEQNNHNKNMIISENILDNMSNADDIDNNLDTKSCLASQTIKPPPRIYFNVFHFFKSHNLYFFIPNSKYDQIKNNNSDADQRTSKNYEIIEDLYLPQAFRPRMNKWSNMPECITGTCKNGGFALIRNFDNCNLIWKLIHPNKMKMLLRNIHNNQKYNHFISTFHLGRKDNLYKHFKYYKRLFPEMFNYAPATYILPVDGPDFEYEYKKNKKALWIVKPVNLSRGRGIHLLRGENEFKSLYKKSTQLTLPQYLISKYIDKPHILNNKKYDLRIYVLVASFTPLRIYLYNNGLVRFATEDYKRGDLDNVFIHLTNYSINKNNLKYKSNQNLKKQQCELFPREETEGTEAEGGLEGEILDEEMQEGEDKEDDNSPDDDSNKWSLIEYRNYFKKIGKGNVMDLIWSQIEAIVIKTIISVSTEFYKNIFPSKINNSFELYGFDILIDEKFRAWLIEVNVNPSLHCTSPLDLSIKTDLISDIFNVVGILPYNHNGNKSVYDYTMINKKKEKNNSVINNYINPNKKMIINNKNVNKTNKAEKEEFNSKMSIKSNILRNYEPDNLEKKLPEYDDEFYKKMIELFKEERSRSNITEFNLLFPQKNNIKTYGKILIKDNAINDYNIVLWNHILTHE